ncbi:MAG: hypothetical protein KA362_00235 [Chloroflexi bacterium]|nr:hypothetical protein [Chloroflexota bacterium]
MVKRAAFIVVLVAFGLLAACATPAPGTGGNPAVYGTQGARMVSDSAATVQAATAAAYQQQFAATASAQTAANATMGAMLVTRDAQDVRLRDMEIAGMATATAAANSAMATATSIALLREATDAEQEAKLVAQEAAVRATAQAQQIKQAQLENQMREFWVAAMPWLTAVVVAMLVGGVFSWMMIRASHSLRAPVYTMPIDQNTMTMLKGPNGWQMLPARATTPDPVDNIVDGEFSDIPPAKWGAFSRWQHVSQVPLGAVIDGERRPLLVDRNEQPHILIAGKTGSGKTRSGMIPYILGMWASSAHVVIINGAGSDFGALRGVPNISFFPQADERELVRPLADFLDATVRELQRRDSVLARYGAGTWRDLPHQAGEDGEILIAIDEFLAIILAAGELKKGIMASRDYESQAERRMAADEVDHMVYLMWASANKIASKSRKLGIHLLLSLTDPTAQLLGKEGMALRRQSLAVAFRMGTGAGSRAFLDTSRDNYPQGSVGLPTGQFLANMDGEIRRCVSFYPSANDVQQFIQLRAPGVNYNDLPQSLSLPGGASSPALPPSVTMPQHNNGRSDADYIRGKISDCRSVTAVARVLGRERGELGENTNASGDHIAAARVALVELARGGDAEAARILAS